MSIIGVVTLGILMYLNRHSPSSTENILVEVTESGGFCNGPCPTHGTHRILLNGVYLMNNKKITTLWREDIEHIQYAIAQTDFDALRQRTPVLPGDIRFGCASDVDGADLVYRFFIRGSATVIDLCKIPIANEEEPFQTIEGIRGKVWKSFIRE